VKSWGKKVIDGVEYDLTHLDSAVIDVSAKTDPSVSFRVLVSYGHHCFAREVLPSDPDHHLVVEGSDRRCFCPIRTSLSKELPRLVREASTGMAFFSEGRNMLIVDDVPGGPYAASEPRCGAFRRFCLSEARITRAAPCRPVYGIDPEGQQRSQTF